MGNSLNSAKHVTKNVYQVEQDSACEILDIMNERLKHWDDLRQTLKKDRTIDFDKLEKLIKATSDMLAGFKISKTKLVAGEHVLKSSANYKDNLCDTSLINAVSHDANNKNAQNIITSALQPSPKQDKDNRSLTKPSDLTKWELDKVAPPNQGKVVFKRDGKQMKDAIDEPVGDKQRILSQNGIDELRKANDKLQEKNHELEAQIKHMENATSKPFGNNKQIQDELVKLRVANAKLLEEKNQLTDRLSKVMSDKMVVNNPEICDLSDSNRPTKLGEMYGLLYDDEWTNAYEAIEKAGYNERETIDTLRDTLKSVYFFCQMKSDKLRKTTTEAVNTLFMEYRDTTVSKIAFVNATQSKAKGMRMIRETSSSEDVKLQEKWKPKNKVQQGARGSSAKPKQQTEVLRNTNVDTQIMKMQKEVGAALAGAVEKAYVKTLWDGEECIAELEPFIKKCLFICWMMVIQNPPMCFSNPDDTGPFVDHLYKAYRTQGKSIDYVVWPAMLIQRDGNVVTKGSAEAKP